jgi:hypothetical protein
MLRFALSAGTLALVIAIDVAIGEQSSHRVSAAGSAEAPARLSETGLYVAGSVGVVDGRNRRFSPQYPLWSDGAIKTRWVFLPPGAAIDARDDGAWEFPVGTRFWKEFAFDGRKVETRMLWKAGPAEWVAVSYQWNEAQTDAVLASNLGEPNVAPVANRQHSIPSRSDCLACHGARRTEPLGFNALQLSTDRDPNALHAETLTGDMVTLKTLLDENLMTPRRPELVANPPRIAAASPITRTALGYLSANCGNCHNRDSSIASLGLDLLQSPPASTSECSAVGKRGHWVVPEAPEESRIINPGHPESSALIRRVKSRRPISQMPPIGTVVVDRAAVDLLTKWVQDGTSELATRCASS